MGCETCKPPDDRPPESHVADAVRICLMCGVSIAKEAAPDIYTLDSFLADTPPMIAYVHPNGVCRYSLTGRAQNVVCGD